MANVTIQMASGLVGLRVTLSMAIVGMLGLSPSAEVLAGIPGPGPASGTAGPLAAAGPFPGTLAGQGLVQDEPDSWWEVDIDAAIQAAQADGKYLLLDFTGSDWCPPCIRLENEVLSHDSFLREASRNFHLVKLDFPQNQALVPVRLLEKNQEWMKRLGVAGFPTIVLMDHQGQPFGFMGYVAGGPPAFLEQIQRRLANKARFDQLVEQAAGAEGGEQARLLDQALESLGLTLGQTHYKELVEKILELDPVNELGYREKYRGDLDAEQRKAILADLLLMVRLRPPSDVLDLMDAMVAEIPLTPQMEAAVLQIRVDLERRSGLTEAALRSLDRMAELYQDDPDAWQRVMVRKFYLLVAAGQNSEAVSILESGLTLRPRSPRLLLARGDWQQRQGQLDQALLSYDQGLALAADFPDLRWELMSAKADLLFGAGQGDAAVDVLETYASNQQFPADLRAKALVHKAIFLRQQDKERAALLIENRALGLIESPRRRAELERLIREVRSAFE